MMIRFNSYLTESKENVNVHLEHLEDLVLNQGISGARDAITFLTSLSKMLSGHTKSSVNITTKWDGCVHPDSLVLTGRGMRRIEEVQPDDVVLSKDLGTGSNGYAPVLGTNIGHKGKRWVSLELELGCIRVTEDHKILTKNRGWVEARNLTLEDDIEDCELLNKSDGYSPLI